MGISHSIPKTKQRIGRANVSAPGILRLYNLEDKVFPYRVSDDLDKFPKINLKFQEAKLETKIKKYMNLSPRDYPLTVEEEEIFRNVYKREETARGIILKGQKAHPLYQNQEDDKSQIYLCRQFLIELDENIGELIELKILQACCNYLTKLPPSICLLQNLKVLILSRNRIKKLPDDMGDLESLRELNVSHNFLEDLPPSMIRLKSLNSLHIDNNRFKKIPNFIVKLTSLKYFNISHNSIREIPFRLFHLPFLIELTAEGCPLKFYEKFEKIDNLSLKEICSRRLLRKNLMVYKRIDVPLTRYLFSAEECSFCGGPLFDSFYNVVSKHIFDGVSFPIAYKICDFHYPSHEGRLETLYRHRLETFPFPLIVEEMTSVTDLFHMPFFHKPSLLGSFNNFQGKTSLKKLSRYNRLSISKCIKSMVSSIVSDEDE